ncbi:hypothetical protein [Aquiflexum lacus]|uniref:hypothetical protein n=1 Tax=Aquiflexum lacus TaxID=2483805 RepID=UPI001895A38B|nr:hypothetical protein [Aquiflexum lacus]
MKVLVLIGIIWGIAFEAPSQKLEIRNFSITPEVLEKGSKVLIAFEVYNPGPVDLPKDSFKMEVKTNGKLVSLDDDTNPLKSKSKQMYSKERGKYHYLVSDEKELIVEIILSPKNNLVTKSELKKIFQISQ